MYPSIVIVPTQGFCNRLRALVSAHILANHWKTKCYVIWEKEEACNVMMNDVFSCQFETIDINIVGKAKHFYSPNTHTNAVLQSDSKLLQFDYLVNQGGHEFKHPDMSVFSFLQRKHEFYKSLTFSEPINRMVSSVSFENKKVIGIHFRDFVEKYDKADGYDFTKVSPLDEFVNWIKRIRKTQPDTYFFVSSNTNSILNKLGDRTDILTLENEEKRRDSADGIVHAVSDLLLLSKCQYIIGSISSSFSDEACFFNFITKYCLGKKRDSVDVDSASYHCYGFAQLYEKNMLLPNLNILCDMYKENF